jgi:hypothetical protein
MRKERKEPTFESWFDDQPNESGTESHQTEGSHQEPYTPIPQNQSLRASVWGSQDQHQHQVPPRQTISWGNQDQGSNAFNQTAIPTSTIVGSLCVLAFGLVVFVYWNAIIAFVGAVINFFFGLIILFVIIAILGAGTRRRRSTVIIIHDD